MQGSAVTNAAQFGQSELDLPMRRPSHDGCAYSTASLLVYTLALLCAPPITACSVPQRTPEPAYTGDVVRLGNNAPSRPAMETDAPGGPVAQANVAHASYVTPIPVDSQHEKSELRLLPNPSAEFLDRYRQIDFADTQIPNGGELPGSLAMLESYQHDAWDMTMEDVIGMAFNHPLLRAKQEEIDRAEAQLVTAGTLENPQFVVDVETPPYGGRRTELTARLMFPIPTAHKVRKRQYVAWAAIREAHAALELETERIQRAAADAAVEVMYYQELLLLNEELADIAEEIAENFVPFQADPTDPTIPDEYRLDRELRVQFGGVDARQAVLATEADLEAARLRLVTAMGQSHIVHVRLQGKLVYQPKPILPLDSVLAIATARNPEIAEAAATLTRARRQNTLAYAERIPDIEFGPRYQDRLGVDDDMIGGRLDTDLPLFNKNRGPILESCADIRINTALLEAAQLRTANEIVSAYRELLTIVDQLEYFRTVTSGVIDETRKKLSDSRDLITGDVRLAVQRSLLSKRIDHLQLKFRYHQLVSSLELAVGGSIFRESADDAAAQDAAPSRLNMASRTDDMKPIKAPPSSSPNYRSILDD